MDRDRRLPLEVTVIWLLFALVAVEIVVTYARIPAHELYHVSGSGLEGGASRALVFFDFPAALVAVAVLALVFDSLPGLALKLAAGLSALLALVVVWPGVVDQANLDAKPVNALPALGVLSAFCLTAIVARHGLSRRPRQPGDPLRVLLALALIFAALPWFAADLGFFLSGVPGIDHVFQTAHASHRLPGEPGTLPAVHHGHHHGMDGLLLVLTALLLSRRFDAVRTRALRVFLSGYLAVMLCYGVANMANDFWREQVVKRGWTSWEIPNVLEPRASAAWGLILLAAAVVWALARVTSTSSGRRRSRSAARAE